MKATTWSSWALQCHVPTSNLASLSCGKPVCTGFRNKACMSITYKFQIGIPQTIARLPMTLENYECKIFRYTPWFPDLSRAAGLLEDASADKGLSHVGVTAPDLIGRVRQRHKVWGGSKCSPRLGRSVWALGTLSWNTPLTCTVTQTAQQSANHAFMAVLWRMILSRDPITPQWVLLDLQTCFRVYVTPFRHHLHWIATLLRRISESIFSPSGANSYWTRRPDSALNSRGTTFKESSLVAEEAWWLGRKMLTWCPGHTHAPWQEYCPAHSSFCHRSL